MHKEGHIVHLFKCIVHTNLCKSKKVLSITSGTKGLMGAGYVLNGDTLLVRLRILYPVDRKYLFPDVVHHPSGLLHRLIFGLAGVEVGTVIETAHFHFRAEHHAPY
jgi:hypothetical protein